MFKLILPGGVEVLVVDGLSSDGTLEKLAEWQKRRPEIHVLSNPRGIAPAAMNIGIRAARGELILRLDAHSTYPPSICDCVLKHTPGSLRKMWAVWW